MRYRRSDSQAYAARNTQIVGAWGVSPALPDGPAALRNAGRQSPNKVHKLGEMPDRASSIAMASSVNC